MKTSHHTTSVAAFATYAGLLFSQTSAGAGFSGAQNLAVYWGQNSYGQGSGSLAQQSLATYCANTNIDIIPMAFVTNITTGTGGAPVVNYANSGNNCTIFPGTALWDCPTIGQDITTCQQKYGKTILVSIGGSAYTEAGFKSQAAAISAATLIWNTFGPVNSSSNAQRPFHSAVVDGFDLDLEQKNNYFRAFGLQLRSLMSADKSKPYYLTAAPQCPYPDPADDPMFNDSRGGVPFDAIFVQYYNNPGCGLQSYTAGTSTQANFNFKTWNDWATQKSANKNVRVFLGVPAGPTGAQNGYTTAANLKPIINYCKGFSNFGGVMAWDASQAAANVPFLANVKTALKTTSKRWSAGRQARTIMEFFGV